MQDGHDIKEVFCEGVGVSGICILAVYHKFDIFPFEKVFKEVDGEPHKPVAVQDHNLADSAAVAGVQYSAQAQPLKMTPLPTSL